MIYLQLFWTFFKIGLFTIGGGQAMIPMITNDVAAMGWLTEEQIIEFIAIAESTPGPFAVNIATYAGIETAGIGGAVMATLGVVLPSIIIIILVATLFSSFMKRRAVQEVFVGVRSTVTGLLLAVLLGLIIKILFGINNWKVDATPTVDYTGIIMYAILLPASFIKIKGKKIKPILLVIVSAILGVICYGAIPLIWA